MKKAQAAMEFLMTYGWAILVVLAAIAALAYFGVLSPDKFLPEKCTFPSGFGCVDFVATSGADTSEIVLVLQNGAGFSVTVSDISLASDTKCTLGDDTVMGTTSGGDDIWDGNAVNDWINGDKAYLEIECDTDLQQDTKIKEEITITYLTENSLSKTVVGDLQTKVQ